MFAWLCCKKKTVFLEWRCFVIHHNGPKVRGPFCCESVCVGGGWQQSRSDKLCLPRCLSRHLVDWWKLVFVCLWGSARVCVCVCGLLFTSFCQHVTAAVSETLQVSFFCEIRLSGGFFKFLLLLFTALNLLPPCISQSPTYSIVAYISLISMHVFYFMIAVPNIHHCYVWCVCHWELSLSLLYELFIWRGLEAGSARCASL